MSQPAPDPGRSPRPGARSVCAVAAAVVLHLVLQAHDLLFCPAPLRRLRVFASGDQMGYLAIVTQVAHGNMARVEPYTLTGVNTYPRLYYTLVGLVARAGLGPVTAWNLVALCLQALMAAVLATTVLTLTRRRWTALLAPVPFLLGPVVTHGWRIGLTGHAKVWGPFGVLTPLNGEAAGLCLGVVACCVLLLAVLRGSWRLAAVGAALVGVVANVQTYSFLTAVYVVASVAAVWELDHAGHRRSRTASAALFVVLFLAGPPLGHHVGQLALLVLGLAPTVPGLLLLVRRLGGRAAGLVGLVAVAASPQLLMTLHDQAAGDPFLTYRVASNVDLGVVAVRPLVAALSVWVPMALLWRGARTDPDADRPHMVRAVVAGLAVLWPLLAANDLWGANAEPYRFWIEMFLFSSVALLLGVCLLGRRARAAMVACVVALLLGLPGYLSWATDGIVSSAWDPSSSRARAIDAASSQADGGLVLAGPCIDPQQAKIAGGARIAYYRLGMAWPAHRGAIDAATAGVLHGTLDPRADRTAGIGWLLEDEACPRVLAGDRGTVVATVGYVSAPPGVGASATARTEASRIVLRRLPAS